MTAIVAVKDEQGGVWMGGDSAATCPGTLDQSIEVRRKVFRNGDLLLGVSGDIRTSQLLHYRLEVPEHSQRKTVERYLAVDVMDAMRKCLGDAAAKSTKDGVETFASSYLLMAYRGRIFVVWSNFGWTEVGDPYQAIGSGAPYAMGALEALKDGTPEERVREALRVAAKHNVGVHDPFHLEYLPSPVTPAT